MTCLDTVCIYLFFGYIYCLLVVLYGPSILPSDCQDMMTFAFWASHYTSLSNRAVRGLWSLADLDRIWVVFRGAMEARASADLSLGRPAGIP